MKTALKVNPEHIPDVLKRVPQWVCWRYAPAPDGGKPRKLPINPRTGELASISDPNTWADFTTACEACERNGYAGLWLALTPELNLVAIDLDDVIGEGLPDWVTEIVRKMSTYTEVSPSGKGLRLVAFGKLPGTRNRTTFNGYVVEMYDHNRFISFTGHHLPGTPTEVCHRQQEIVEIYEIVFGEPAPPPTQPTGDALDLSDEEILQRAMTAENGAKFRALWNGDDTGYPSPSEADMALASMLLFWCNGDVARAERLFSSSPRGQREKWRDRPDYRQRTMEAALTGKTEFYEPHRRNGTDTMRVMTKFVPRRFTEKILEHYQFYSCGDLRTGDFYRFDPEAGVWREDAEAFLANLLREDSILPEEWKRESHVREVVADVRQLCWREEPLPTPPPTLIPFANGVFDLSTARLRDYAPEDGFTTKLPWRYDPEAHSELLAERLGAFPEAIRMHFMELLAYCLWRGYPLQRAFFWIGKASAGKSHLMRMLTTALGAENVANVTLHDLSENRFAVAQLHRKLLALSGELRYDDLERTDVLKALTGGDSLTADRKYREPVTFRNHAKLLFTGNALPLTHDKTDAFYRRSFVVRFEHQFAEDPRIETELDLLPPDVKAREFSWLLTQAVEVLRRLLENGFQMTGDVSVDQKRRTYEELSDPLLQFIEEHCERTRRTDDYVFKFEFGERLNAWLEARGLNQYQTRRVNQRMRELGFEESRKGHEKYWAWIGLKWREVPEVPEVPDSTNRSKLASNRVVNIGTSGTLGTEPPQNSASPPDYRTGWCGVCSQTTVHRPYRLSNGMLHWECCECHTVRQLEEPHTLAFACRAVETALRGTSGLTLDQLRKRSGLPHSVFDEALASMLRTGEVVCEAGTYSLQEPVDDG